MAAPPAYTSASYGGAAPPAYGGYPAPGGSYPAPRGYPAPAGTSHMPAPAYGTGTGAGAAARTAGAAAPAASTLDVKSEMRLHSGSEERRKFEALADLYEVIKCTEHIETAYVRDAITPDAYTSACNRLISQFKTVEKTLRSNGYITDVESFMREYGLQCERAKERLLRVGVPATVVHRTSDGRGESVHVAETVQYFITAMDSLRLNMRAVDEIQPLLSDLMSSISKNSALPKDFDGQAKVQHWLETLNAMRASEELDDDQARQLSFDLDSAYGAFHRWLQEHK